MLVLAACSAAEPVALPARDASSSVVLGAYLRALKSGDCDSAHALAATSFIRGNGELCGAVTVTAYTQPGTPAAPRDGEVIFSITLTIGSGDDSLPAGDHTWFYSLDRRPDGAWRLVGGGSGP